MSQQRLRFDSAVKGVPKLRFGPISFLFLVCFSKCNERKIFGRFVISVFFRVFLFGVYIRKNSLRHSQRFVFLKFSLRSSQNVVLRIVNSSLLHCLRIVFKNRKELTFEGQQEVQVMTILLNDAHHVAVARPKLGRAYSYMPRD